MRTSSHRRVPIGVISLLIGISVAVGFFSDSGSSQAIGNFNASTTQSLCAFTGQFLQTTCTESAGDLSASNASQITTKLTIPVDQMNFSNITYFTAPGAIVASGASTPVGAGMGILFSPTKLGLVGGPCNNSVDLVFLLMNSSVDNGNTGGTAADYQAKQVYPLPNTGTRSGGEGVLEPVGDDDNWNIHAASPSGGFIGTASGGSNSTLVDGDATYGVNELQNMMVHITKGAAAGQARNISSNTATTLTVAPDWTTTNPGATSEYMIVDDGNDADDTNKVPSHVDRYPSYFNKMFDPDRVGDINDDGDEYDTVSGVAENPGATGPANGQAGDYGTVKPIKPLARYSSFLIVTGLAVVVDFVVFDKVGNGGADDDLSAFEASNPLADLADPNLGYPAVTTLQDPTAPTAPSDITDFCSGLAVTTFLSGTSLDNACTGAVTACANDDTTCGESEANQCGASNARNAGINSSPDPCTRGVDDDLSDAAEDHGANGGIGFVNDGCPRAGFADEGPGADCADAADDDTDGRINDGCVKVGNDSEDWVAGGPQDTTGCDFDTNEEGCTRYTNPATTGTHYYYAFHQSLRDADADGLENSLDTCPYTNTGDSTGAGYNPRDAVGGGVNPDDVDEDLLPGGGGNGGCDPVPGTAAAGLNQDGDSLGGKGWQNSGDNCPRAANDNAKDNESNLRYTDAAPRGGPKSDGIGDVCDTVPDGSTNGPDKSDGHFHTTLSLVAKCIGLTDTDGDGYCDTTEDLLGSCKSDAGTDCPTPASTGCTVNGTALCFVNGTLAVDSKPEHSSLVRFFPVAHSGSGTAPPGPEPVQLCNDGADNDKDSFIDLLEPDRTGNDPGPTGLGFTAPDCMPILSSPDTDSDGFSDEAEVYMGTDALGRCELPDISPSTDWPADIASTGAFSRNKINVEDLGKFVAPVRRLNSIPGDGKYDKRWDLVPGTTFGANWINSGDMGNMLVFKPTMDPYSGAKAYNHASTCTAHPVFGD